MDVYQILLGYLVSTIGGAIVLWFLIDILAWNYVEQTSKVSRKPPNVLTIPLGIIERLLYTTAIIVGFHEWIAIWLAMKVAISWKAWENKEERVTYNVFLIGNALSILFGFLGAWIVLGKYMIYEKLSNHQWLITNNIQIAVAVGILFLAYMAYIQMKEINVSDLKGLIRQWQKNLVSYKVGLSEDPIPSEMPSSLKEFLIENHAIFEDLFHNFPDLRNAWNDFKNLDSDYYEKRQELVGKIKRYIEQTLKERSLNLESENQKEFIFSVYRETILKTKDKNGGDYSENDVIVDGIRKRGLIFKHSETDYRLYIAVIEPEKIEEVKGIHKEIIKECEKLYLDSIKEMIEIENRTRDSNNELKFALRKIILRIFFQYP